MIGGNDSFVHTRLRNAFVCVDIDLPDTNTLSVFFVVHKCQEIGYIRTHTHTHSPSGLERYS